MQTATIFNYKGLSEEEIAITELRLALEKTAGERLLFLTELIELSAFFSLRPENKPVMNESTSLYQQVFSFFKNLEAHQVAYLLIGGFAVNAYGFARNTGDLDIWVKDSPTNRKALGKACAGSGVAGGELLENMDWVPGWTGFRLPNGYKVEILGHLAAFSENDFDACFERAEFIELEGISIPVLNIEDLLKEKQALGRPKDREDIVQLLRIKGGLI